MMYQKCLKHPYYCLYRFGGRFFALNNCYDRSFRKMARDVANEIGMGNSFHEGVYTMLGGPNFGKKKYLAQKTNSMMLEFIPYTYYQRS